MAQRIIIDANLCVALIIPLPYSEAAGNKWHFWEINRVSLYAPLLWEYEVISAFRKAITAGLIDRDEAEKALQRLFTLGVETVPPNNELHRSALRWSERIRQSVAYDGQYLALTEALQGDFWTADKRLIDVLKGQSLAWLHWIGEST
jgi:predicted nucleic acid-binding protein